MAVKRKGKSKIIQRRLQVVAGIMEYEAEGPFLNSVLCMKNKRIKVPKQQLLH